MRYSKLFGSIIAGVVGLGAAAGLNTDFATPELVTLAAVVAGQAFGTWVAPANRPT